METPENNIPPRLNEIIGDFSDSEGREKLELLLEFSDRMPPLPQWLKQNHDQMDQVHECATSVYIHADHDESGMTFYFDVPAESPTIRGYAALLAEGLRGATPTQVLQVPDDFYHRMGLQQVMSPQRLNGMSAILAYIKRLSLREMGGQQSTS